MITEVPFSNMIAPKSMPTFPVSVSGDTLHIGVLKLPLNYCHISLEKLDEVKPDRPGGSTASGQRQLTGRGQSESRTWPTGRGGQGGGRVDPLPLAARRVDSGHLLILDSGHLLTLDSGHSLMLDSGHSLTLDSGHSLTLDSGHSLTLDSGHALTLDSGHSLTLYSGHSLIVASGLADSTQTAIFICFIKKSPVVFVMHNNLFNLV